MARPGVNIYLNLQQEKFLNEVRGKESKYAYAKRVLLKKVMEDLKNVGKEDGSKLEEGRQGTLKVGY